jgi:hypothetical protein
MAIVTIADVLRRAEEFERAVADLYARLSHNTMREGVRLLARYMSIQRPRIPHALACVPSDRLATIFSTPLCCDPYGADCHCLDAMELPVNASSAEVLDMGVNFNECLARFYRQIVRQPLDRTVVDLFECFIRLEQREEIELKKIKAMNYF